MDGEWRKKNRDLGQMQQEANKKNGRVVREVEKLVKLV